MTSQTMQYTALLGQLDIVASVALVGYDLTDIHNAVYCPEGLFDVWPLLAGLVMTSQKMQYTALLGQLDVVISATQVLVQPHRQCSKMP